MTSPYSCKVVQIVTPVAPGNPHGFTEINETDFDAKKHKLYEAVAPKKLTKAEQEAIDKANEQAKVEAQELADKEAASLAKLAKDAESEAAKAWGNPPAA